MKSTLLTVGLCLLAQACLPKTELCEPCEPGGCGVGFVCTPAQGGAVCAPPSEGPAACTLLPRDAGVDAGASDAGVSDAARPDAGPSGCPTGGDNGLEWVYSAPADLCFTRTEITVRQFEPCHTSTCAPDFSYHRWSGAAWPFCNLEKPGLRDHPMNCIDERGAAAGCAALGGRLPSMAEWRAEASANGTRTYAWGDEPADCTRAVMMTSETPGCDTGDVFVPCSLPAGNSISGLCDMTGNVWEFTSDIQGDRPALCGGSLISTTNPDFLRNDACYLEPGLFSDHGFRCVTDPVR